MYFLLSDLKCTVTLAVMQCCISGSLVHPTYVSDTADLYINQGKLILFFLNKILSGPISLVIVDKVREQKN